jgi:hypothetical protein
MKDPLADYQKSSGFRSGVAGEMVTGKTRDKKLVFIEPTNKHEQE